MAVKAKVLVKFGSYRGNEVKNQEFTLLEDYKEGAKGGYLTVEGSPLGWPGPRRVLVNRKDYEVVGTVNLAASDIPGAGSAMESAAFLRPEETDDQILARQHERFEILGDVTDAVANGDIRALIVSGAPGIGKTFGVSQKLEMYQQFDELRGSGIKHQLIKGTMTAIGLYITLWNYREKNSVVVFDDCDSLFYDDETLNLLKAALDSSKKRTLSYAKDSKALRELGIDNQFDFEGGIIFISNLNFDHIKSRKLQDHLQALKSRCHYLDLTIHTAREKMLRINDLVTNGSMLKDLELELGMEEKILAFVVEHQAEFPELSLRTVLKIAQLAKSFPNRWEAMSRITVVGQ